MNEENLRDIQKKFVEEVSDFRKNGEIEKALESEMKLMKLHQYTRQEETKENLLFLKDLFEYCIPIFEKDGSLEKALYCSLELAKVLYKYESSLGVMLSDSAYVTNKIFERFTKLLNQLEKSNQMDRVYEYRMKKIKIISSVLGENRNVIVNEYMDLAEIFLKGNDLEKARNMMFKAIEIEELIKIEEFEDDTVKAEEYLTTKKLNSIIQKCERVLITFKNVLTIDQTISIYLKVIQYELIICEPKFKDPVFVVGDKEFIREKTKKLRKFYEELSEIYSKNGEVEKAKEMKSLADNVTPTPFYGVLYLENVEKGETLEKEGQIDKAVELYLESIKFHYLQFEKNPKYIDKCGCARLDKLIDKLYESNDVDKFVELTDKKLNVMTSLIDENHPKLEKEYGSYLALLQIKKYNFPKILETFNKLLKIKVALKGETHVDLVETYLKFALYLQINNRCEEALDIYKKAIDIEIKNNGDGTDKLLELYSNISKAYEKINDYDNALVYSNLILDKKVSKNGEFHSNNYEIYSNILSIYLMKNDFTKVEEFREKSKKCKN